MKDYIKIFVFSFVIIGCINKDENIKNDKPNDDSETIAQLIRDLGRHYPIKNQYHSDFDLNMKFDPDSNFCTTLTLSDINLDSLPVELNNFKDLRLLFLYQCNLNNIRGFNDTNLGCITLNENKFKEIPKELCSFKRLGTIDMRNNLLKGEIIIDSLPPKLDNLSLEYNHIEHIKFNNPLSYKNLYDLWLDNNDMTVIDSSIYLLPTLHDLRISGNHIKNIDIKRLKNLTTIEVNENYSFSDDDLKYMKKKNILILRGENDNHHWKW